MNSVNVMLCFRIICLILPAINYRSGKKYVLVLVHCHDRIIRNLINLFLRLTLVFNSCNLVRDNRIMTLDSNQNRIFSHNKADDLPNGGGGPRGGGPLHPGGGGRMPGGGPPWGWCPMPGGGGGMPGGGGPGGGGPVRKKKKKDESNQNL